MDQQRSTRSMKLDTFTPSVVTQAELVQQQRVGAIHKQQFVRPIYKKQVSTTARWRHHSSTSRNHLQQDAPVMGVIRPPPPG